MAKTLPEVEIGDGLDRFEGDGEGAVVGEVDDFGSGVKLSAQELEDMMYDI